VFFHSVVRHRSGGIIAALLTGIGRDGAAGLLALRSAGALTIAQDQETSVVYGMPKAASQLGAAARILPLDEIGPALTAAVK
jgi:chemotaxis response regulator CheB